MHSEGGLSLRLGYRCSWRWCRSVQAAGRQGESWSAGTGQAGSDLGVQVGWQAQPVVDTLGVQWDWDIGGYRDRRTSGDKPGVRDQGAGAEDTGWPYCGGPGNVATVGLGGLQGTAHPGWVAGHSTTG